MRSHPERMSAERLSGQINQYSKLRMHAQGCCAINTRSAPAAKSVVLLVELVLLRLLLHRHLQRRRVERYPLVDAPPPHLLARAVARRLVRRRALQVRRDQRRALLPLPPAAAAVSVLLLLPAPPLPLPPAIVVLRRLGPTRHLVQPLAGSLVHLLGRPPRPASPPPPARRAPPPRDAADRRSSAHGAGRDRCARAHHPEPVRRRGCGVEPVNIRAAVHGDWHRRRRRSRTGLKSTRQRSRGCAALIARRPQLLPRGKDAR
mmetsp:Transcript_23952/g.76910  ORF Transcript_23952/g.76910 Transcript_23952/m.76910 type:complete len:261 (+) Transcript_23952:111-893(+)